MTRSGCSDLSLPVEGLLASDFQGLLCVVDRGANAEIRLLVQQFAEPSSHDVVIVHNQDSCPGRGAFVIAHVCRLSCHERRYIDSYCHPPRLRCHIIENSLKNDIRKFVTIVPAFGKPSPGRPDLIAPQ